MTSSSCAPETEEEQRHRLLVLAECSAAELVCILRAHLQCCIRPPTLELARAILKTKATLTDLEEILPERIEVDDGRDHTSETKGRV